ncbi:MAG: HEAT repeat domain-containing protein [Candidatus Brocadiia bacterium]
MLGLAVLCWSLAARAGEAPALEADIAKLPAKSEAQANAVLERILARAPASIVQLTRMLRAPGEGDDSKVRYAIHGLANYVQRPGAEKERKLFATTLSRQLASDLAPPVKGFLIRQLQLAGGRETIPAIARWLTDELLCEYAAQALLAMGDKAVVAAFREALPKARGACRLTIIQDLGVLGAARGLPAVHEALRDEDREVRLAAAFALANSADREAVDALLEAERSVESRYERSQTTDALLLLARTLGEAGQGRAAERICRHLMQTRTEPGDIHVRCAALLALANATGAEAMDDVLAAMGSDDADYRAAGIAAAIAMPGQKATQQWVQRMKQASAPRRAAILDLLARRGDSSAVPAVLDAMEDPDPAVRRAAYEAILRVGDERAVKPLVAALGSESKEQQRAARTALKRLAGEAVTAAIAERLAGASAPVRAALLDVLAARGARAYFARIRSYADSQEPAVRAAAFSALGRLADASQLPALVELLVEADGAAVRRAAQQALAAACSRVPDQERAAAVLADAMAGAPPPARAGLVSVLGGLDAARALGAIRAALDDPDGGVKDAAIRALAHWPDDRPAEDLLRIARSADQLTHHALALQGYIRMIKLRDDHPVGERLEMCRTALEAARRPEEKRQALSAVADVPDPKALEMAQSYLSQPPLRDEAAISAITIARAISSGEPGAAREAIRRAVAASDSPEVRKQAQEAREFIERNEGYITIWLVSGPYKGKSTQDAHPPETPGAKGVAWKQVAATGQQPGFLDLNEVVGRHENSSAYLKAQVWSPREQKARLEVGSDDGVKVWLDGQVVLDRDVARSFTLDEDRVAVTLKEGWNALRLQVTQGGGDWSVAVRLRAPDGSGLEGIRIRAR